MSADLYLILAALLDCSREEAKRRALKAAYSMDDGVLETTDVAPGATLNRRNASKCGRCGRLWDVAGLINGECPHEHNCLYNTLLPIKRELAESRHESIGLKLALELVEDHRYAFSSFNNAREAHEQARQEYVRLLRDKLQEYGG